MDAHGLQLAPFLQTARVPGWQTSFPLLDRAEAAAVVCVQASGEALFVPSGWHHTVDNLEDTASINHNWLNGNCVRHSWGFMRATFERAVSLIADCRCRAGCKLQRRLCCDGVTQLRMRRETCDSATEFLELAQRILRADIGMDVAEFCELVSSVAHREVATLRQLGVAIDCECCAQEDNLACDGCDGPDRDALQLEHLLRLRAAACVMSDVHAFAVHTLQGEAGASGRAEIEGAYQLFVGATAWPWLVAAPCLERLCVELLSCNG